MRRLRSAQNRVTLDKARPEPLLKHHLLVAQGVVGVDRRPSLSHDRNTPAADLGAKIAMGLSRRQAGLYRAHPLTPEDLDGFCQFSGQLAGSAIGG